MIVLLFSIILALCSLWKRLDHLITYLVCPTDVASFKEYIERANFQVLASLKPEFAPV